MAPGSTELRVSAVEGVSEHEREPPVRSVALSAQNLRLRRRELGVRECAARAQTSETFKLAGRARLRKGYSGLSGPQRPLL